MKKYKEFMFAPDELPVYMADPKVQWIFYHLDITPDFRESFG